MKSEAMVEQVRAVHAAVSERLETIFDDMPIIDAVNRDAAFAGTITALLGKALLMRAIFQAICDVDSSADDDRNDFMQLAGSCWDDAERVGEAATVAMAQMDAQ